MRIVQCPFCAAVKNNHIIQPNQARIVKTENIYTAVRLSDDAFMKPRHHLHYLERKVSRACLVFYNTRWCCLTFLFWAIDTVKLLRRCQQALFRRTHAPVILCGPVPVAVTEGLNHTIGRTISGPKSAAMGPYSVFMFMYSISYTV